MSELPYSQSCENNKEPILGVLRRVFADRRQVLEIGSGTAQHACYFAEQLPQLVWQPSEVPGGLSVTEPRCARYPGANLAAPVALDVTARPWPLEAIPHAVFTANTLHIMPWEAVESMFDELGGRAPPGTCLAVYGPFNYGGRYTSPSNAGFDQWLAGQSPWSAIRDFEAVNRCAGQAGFSLAEDNEMPANNRLLVWRSAAA